jgi:hypothetical protein
LGETDLHQTPKIGVTYYDVPVDDKLETVIRRGTMEPSTASRVFVMQAITAVGAFTIQR